jgi:hypothetical protein
MDPSRRERIAVIAAVNRERERCAGLLERALAKVPAGPLLDRLLDRLQRIRTPWYARRVGKRCCGWCGEQGHYAPRCPLRRQAA